MAGFDFDVALWSALFLVAVWGLGRTFALIKLPPILGQLMAGILLGPRLLDIVPYASDGLCPDRIIDAPSCPDSSLHMRLLGAVGLSQAAPCAADAGRQLAEAAGSCSTVEWSRFADPLFIPNIWMFIGNIGVTLMIMESGMHIHFEKVKEVGKIATVVAILGTGLPMAFGVIFVGAIFSGVPGDATGDDLVAATNSTENLAFYPWGFAAGCAFAPTSVGISIKLLDESKMLNSLAGQTTLTAAFIDDVFSLVTLVILKSLARGAVSARDVLVPIICSFAFLGMAVALAIFVFPHLHHVLNRIPLKKNVSIQPRDEVHLLLMFLTLAFLGWLSAQSEWNGVPFIGSHLLGAFGAGMCWVNVPRSHTIWTAQLKRIVRWMMRIFFAATVGFAVPVKVMFTGSAVWRGAILGIGPCIATKLFSGIFARMRYKSEEAKQLAKSASWATRSGLQPQQLLVGIAMVARGEFAYLVAETAQALQYNGGPERMMSQEVYAAVVWALVMATVCSPVMFRWALGVFDRATPVHRSAYIGGDDKKFARRAFVIRIAGRHAPNVQREIFNALHASGVDILQAHLTSVRTDDAPDAEIESFVNNFTVLSRGAKKDFDDEKLEEIQHTIAEVLNDADAQIIFEPADEDFSTDGVIEVQILGEYHPAVLHEMATKLSEMGLDVIKATMHHSHQPGHAHPAAKENAPGTASPQTGRRSGSDGVSPRTARRSKTDSPVTAGAPGANGTAGAPSLTVETEMDRRPSTGPVKLVKEASTNLTRALHLSTRDGGKKSPAKSPAKKSSSKKAAAKKAAADVEAAAAADKEEASFSRKGHEKRRGSNEHRPSTAGVPHVVDVGRETFYARESDGTKYTTAKRRHAITAALREVLHNHSLHGEVIVRVLHESEIALLHTVPKLDQSKRSQVNIVRCVGEHHKELFHTILDHFDEVGYDVMHADMDMDNKNQENTIFYLMLPEGETDHAHKRRDLEQAIQNLYRSHSVQGRVTVESGEGMSPPSTPSSPAAKSKGTPSKVKRNSLPQALLEEMVADMGGGTSGTGSPQKRRASLPQAFLEEREERRKARASHEQMKLVSNLDGMLDLPSMSADAADVAEAVPSASAAESPISPSAPQDSI